MSYSASILFWCAARGSSTSLRHGSSSRLLIERAISETPKRIDCLPRQSSASWPTLCRKRNCKLRALPAAPPTATPHSPLSHRIVARSVAANYCEGQEDEYCNSGAVLLPRTSGGQQMAVVKD